MERYRIAFIRENQLWLQHVFSDLMDRQTQTEYRSTLLKSLSRILDEVEPQYYSPYNLPPKVVDGQVIQRQVERTRLQAIQATGFEFDSVPPQELAMQQQKQRDFVFRETITQEILRLWLARARFLQWLEDRSELIRP